MGANRSLEMPPEWKGKVPTSVFIEEAQKILKAASENRVILRLLGGLAIKVHSLNQAEFAQQLGRTTEPGQEYSDIDFATYAKFREPVRKVFESLGYSKRPTTLSTSTAQRHIYFHPNNWFYVDVFWDKLRAANHPIDFRGRLEVDPVTIPLADLLLEKLQIVSFSKKDLLDTLLLLKAHNVSDKEETETISTEKIAETLARDWGFWYTVTTNLKGLREHLKKMNALAPQGIAEVTTKVEKILIAADSVPKPFRWVLRSKLGTRKKWYNPVETEETVGEFGIWRLRE